jgi:hypothetical protein
MLFDTDLNEKFMRKMAGEQAKQMFLSADEKEKELTERYLRYVESNGYSKEMENRFDELRSQVRENKKLHTRIVADLVGVSESRGLDYALSEEAEIEAIKAIYPTRQEFLDDMFRNAESTMQKFLNTDGAFSNNSQGDILDKIQESMKEFIRKAVEKRADFIYVKE